ncbi:MAG: FAD:protein FMN transferase [Bryobacteraceae bacterium]|nr:FAD:protein FMN transferase [Bryobacteraceae bacterium]MDW8377291.1 FAD:protein FMN transferase [Bryobacterales bacterium]
MVSCNSLVALHGASLERFEAVEPHMGTLVQIRLYARDAVAAQRVFERAFQRIRELEEKLSDYRPDSEFTRLSRSPKGVPIPVSHDVMRVIELAQEIAQATGGAFDITLGPLVSLWREARKTKQLPEPYAVAIARQRCGYQFLRIDKRRHTVTLLRDSMLLDAGGIAKGFAASEVVRLLRSLGVSRVLVAVSGDIAVGDPPPGKAGWMIEAEGEVYALQNAAISTSGDEHQFVEIGGLRYSHILDPAIGLGLTRSKPVSIVAPEGAVADALATACSVRPCSAELLSRFQARQLFPSPRTTSEPKP